MTIRSYKDLMVWQKAMELAKSICQATQSFPDVQRYILVSQLQRAAISVPSNIAEGYGRSSEKELARFLNIASGSLCELETQLLLAESLGFIEKNELEELTVLSTEVTKMLYGLRRSITERKNNEFAEAEILPFAAEVITTNC